MTEENRPKFEKQIADLIARIMAGNDPEVQKALDGLDEPEAGEEAIGPAPAEALARFVWLRLEGDKIGARVPADKKDIEEFNKHVPIFNKEAWRLIEDHFDLHDIVLGIRRGGVVVKVPKRKRVSFGDFLDDLFGDEGLAHAIKVRAGRFNPDEIVPGTGMTAMQIIDGKFCHVCPAYDDCKSPDKKPREAKPEDPAPEADPAATAPEAPAEPTTPDDANKE